MNFEDYAHNIGQAYIQNPADSRFRDSVLGEFPIQEYRFSRLSRDGSDSPEFIGIDHATGNDRSAVAIRGVRSIDSSSEYKDILEFRDILEYREVADQYSLIAQRLATISTMPPPEKITLEGLNNAYKKMTGKNVSQYVGNIKPTIKEMLSEIRQMIGEDKI